MDSSSLFSFLNKQLSPAIIDRYLELLADSHRTCIEKLSQNSLCEQNVRNRASITGNSATVSNEIKELQAKNQQLKYAIYGMELELVKKNNKIIDYENLLVELEKNNKQLQETVESLEQKIESQKNERIIIADRIKEFEKIISNMDDRQIIKLSKPEKCCYYPNKHELILLNDRLKTSFGEIEQKLLKITPIYGDRVKPVWFKAVHSILKISELRKIQFYWARKHKEIVLMNNKGKQISNRHASYVLIPAVILFPDRSFLDYLLNEDWQVHHLDPNFDVIQSILLTLNFK